MNNIEKGLLLSSLRHIGDKKIREGLSHARSKEMVWRQVLTELSEVANYVNITPVEQIPQDMVNTRLIKETMNTSNKPLLSPLDAQVHTDPANIATYKEMLRLGNSLLGSFFVFHLNLVNPQDVLAGSAIDGYALHLSIYFNKNYQNFVDIGSNMICEVLAQIHSNEPTRPLLLFEFSKSVNWYDYKYGINIDFLTRHNLGPKLD